MPIPTPVHANREALQDLIRLAREPRPTLNLFLRTDLSDLRENNLDALRLRARHLLDALEENLAGTPWERAFRSARQEVEDYLKEGVELGPPALALVVSPDAPDLERAVWLPTPVRERARYGPGVYTLPFVEVLDEWEPVLLAIVGKDKATLVLWDAGTLAEAHHFETEDLPPKHRAGGWASARFQRHHRWHAELHLKRVAEQVEELYRRYRFRRWFVAGPVEPVSLFRQHLPRELAERLKGHLSFAREDTEKEIEEKVKRASWEVEHREEAEQVEALLARSAKNAGAVVGLAPTLWALNRREAYLLVLSAEPEQKGRFCPACEIALPPEAVFCPQCSTRTIPVNLWEELPRLAMASGTLLEVVHGPAQERLGPFGGLGAFLRPGAS